MNEGKIKERRKEKRNEYCEKEKLVYIKKN